MKTFRALIVATFLSITAAHAGQALPLEAGNYWIYRQVGGLSSFEITVGLPALIQGRVYHRLSGYVEEPIWVRVADGVLYYFDEERGEDLLLTAFVPTREEWFEAPLRPCRQIGRVHNERVPFDGASGRFEGAVRIDYASLNCADAGHQEETFVENIGMVRRVVTAIDGPRTHDLVSARVGRFRLQERPGSSLELSVSPRSSRLLLATLRLMVESETPLKLTYPSSQEFDLRLRDSDGRVIWQWSEDKFFLPVLREVTVDSQVLHEAEVPLVFAGRTLPAGVYTLEAWLTAGDSFREFAASVAVPIGLDEQRIEGRAEGSRRGRQSPEQE